MAQGILRGFDVLALNDLGDSYEVVYGFRRFAAFRKDDAVALRIVVVELVQMGVKKTELMRRFGVHRDAIADWVKVYEKGGMEALAALKVGRPDKVTDSMKDYIIALYKRLERRYGYRKTIIQEVEKVYGVTISHETIRRVINEWKAKNAPTQEQLSEGASEAAVERETSKDESGEESKHEKASSVVKEVQAADAAPEIAPCCEASVEAHEDAPETMVRHGGVLLALPMMQQYNVEDMIPETLKKNDTEYSYLECFLSILFLLMARLLRVEENIKLHDDPRMGGLINRPRLPSLRTVRDKMAQLVEKVKEDIQSLKVEFARLYLSRFSKDNPYYIDNHFMPYFGEEPTLTGYCTQRRMPQKGRTAYVLNTSDARPIYEVLSDGYDQFAENMDRAIDVLTKNLEVERPTLVFDRGGCDTEHLVEVEKRADFISWYRGDVAPPRKATWETVQVPVESNMWGEPKYEDVECTEEIIQEADDNGRGFRRMFFLRDGEHISPAITCKKDVTLAELVRHLTARWGAQENPFKELKLDGYDRLHSYEKDKFSERYLREAGLDPTRRMENPEHKKLAAERRKLNAKRERILGRQAVKESTRGKPAPLSAAQRAKLTQIESELNVIQERLQYLPETILRMDYIRENGIVRLRSDKKEFFDLMLFIAFTVRKDLAEVIGPVYENNRDIHQIVLKFLTQDAMVRQTPKATIITFRAPHAPRERAALEHLCGVLTFLQGTSRLFPGKLVYRVR